MEGVAGGTRTAQEEDDAMTEEAAWLVQSFLTSQLDSCAPYAVEDDGRSWSDEPGGLEGGRRCSATREDDHAASPLLVQKGTGGYESSEKVATRTGTEAGVRETNTEDTRPEGLTVGAASMADEEATGSVTPDDDSENAVVSNGPTTTVLGTEVSMTEPVGPVRRTREDMTPHPSMRVTRLHRQQKLPRPPPAALRRRQAPPPRAVMAVHPGHTSRRIMRIYRQCKWRPPAPQLPTAASHDCSTLQTDDHQPRGPSKDLSLAICYTMELLAVTHNAKGFGVYHPKSRDIVLAVLHQSMVSACFPGLASVPLYIALEHVDRTRCHPHTRVRPRVNLQPLRLPYKAAIDNLLQHTGRLTSTGSRVVTISGAAAVQPANAHRPSHRKGGEEPRQCFEYPSCIVARQTEKGQVKGCVLVPPDYVSGALSAHPLAFCLAIASGTHARLQRASNHLRALADNNSISLLISVATAHAWSATQHLSQVAGGMTWLSFAREKACIGIVSRLASFLTDRDVQALACTSKPTVEVAMQVLKVQKASVRVQSCARGSAGRAEAKRRCLQRTAATTLQRTFRGHAVRRTRAERDAGRRHRRAELGSVADILELLGPGQPALDSAARHEAAATLNIALVVWMNGDSAQRTAETLVDLGVVRMLAVHLRHPLPSTAFAVPFVRGMTRLIEVVRRPMEDLCRPYVVSAITAMLASEDTDDVKAASEYIRAMRPVHSDRFPHVFTSHDSLTLLMDILEWPLEPALYIHDFPHQLNARLACWGAAGDALLSLLSVSDDTMRRSVATDQDGFDALLGAVSGTLEVHAACYAGALRRYYREPLLRCARCAAVKALQPLMRVLGLLIPYHRFRDCALDADLTMVIEGLLRSRCIDNAHLCGMELLRNVVNDKRATLFMVKSGIPAVVNTLLSMYDDGPVRDAAEAVAKAFAGTALREELPTKHVDPVVAMLLQALSAAE